MPKYHLEFALEYEESTLSPSIPRIEILRSLLDPDGGQRALEANQRLYEQAMDRFKKERHLLRQYGWRFADLDDEEIVVRTPGGWDGRAPGFEEEGREAGVVPFLLHFVVLLMPYCLFVWCLFSFLYLFHLIWIWIGERQVEQ